MKALHRLERALLSVLPAAATMLAGGGYPIQTAAQQPQVIIFNPWARATPSHVGTAAVYMILTSEMDDRLSNVATPIAQQAELHRTTNEGGVIRMRPVSGGLELPAGKPVSLSPAGYHIMLIGLKEPLRAGKSVPVHLTFERAAPADIQVMVQPISGTAGSMPGMKMN